MPRTAAIMCSATDWEIISVSSATELWFPAVWTVTGSSPWETFFKRNFLVFFPLTGQSHIERVSPTPCRGRPVPQMRLCAKILICICTTNSTIRTRWCCFAVTILYGSHRRRSSFRHCRQVENESHPDCCGSPQSDQSLPSPKTDLF